MKTVTCVAPVNIAVIKYWGKRDEQLILPINDSFSCTLSTEFMCAKTTILASPLLKENKFWLNGKEETLDNPRLQNCLTELKRRANPSLPEVLTWNLAICSVNNFPTAAGLASSAAGYACLVTALAALYEVKGDISDIARRGSGSACRSVYGGFVHWYKGQDPNGADSIAKQIFPASHWPEMRVLILVVNDQKKKTPSTTGMKRGVDTSDLLHFRAEQLVQKRIHEITSAIQQKDFDTFAKITMQDSNQFHACCLDTHPPCIYLNEVSYKVIDLVHAYNNYRGANKVAYTFDAGPNACLYILEEDVEEFVSIISYVFALPLVNSEEYLRGLRITPKPVEQQLKMNLNLQQNDVGCLKYVIYTRTGNGPKIITDPSQHLLTETGLPKA